MITVISVAMQQQQRISVGKLILVDIVFVALSIGLYTVFTLELDNSSQVALDELRRFQ